MSLRGDLQNPLVSQPGRALPSLACPKQCNQRPSEVLPVEIQRVSPAHSLVHTQGSGDFFSHWHKGQLQQILCSLLQRQQSALACQAPNKMLFAIFTVFPSSCLHPAPCLQPCLGTRVFSVCSCSPAQMPSQSFIIHAIFSLLF